MPSAVTAILLLSLALPVQPADSIEGLWRTFDDRTGDNKGIIRITIVEGEALGIVEKVFPPPGVDPEPLCVKCSGELKNQRIRGMRVLWGFALKGDAWVGGRVLDPEHGREYRGKIWLHEDGTLKVRGYRGFFFRTQTWVRQD